jgi:hypothetical protein
MHTSLMSSTPFFAGFHKILFGRRPSNLAKQRDLLGSSALDHLSFVFGPFLPNDVLKIDEAAKGKGKNSREAIFTPTLVFWAFLSQVLSPGCSCRQALTKVQIWCARLKCKLPVSDTSAYCKARHRLQVDDLKSIHRHSARQLEANTPRERLWKGLRALLVDATGVSMPDSKVNQARWPQSSNQAEGCGFPAMTLVGLFSLASCALIDFAQGALRDDENGLFYKMKHLIGKGDVIVGDRLYCTYANICWLLGQSAEVVFRKHESRNNEKGKIEPLGKNDRIVHWSKPQSKGAHSGVTRLLWEKLRPTLRLREVTFKIACKGYRTREVILMTTLLDPAEYPLEDLAELYLKRWRIELWFDDIKTSMQMDVLRCKTPEMIEKEVYMHMIAYNLVRSVMHAAATMHGECLEVLSFKGTVDRLREWAWPIYNASNTRERESMKSKLLKSIAEDLLEERAGRYEPRVVKRRPKAYPFMKKPRQKYRDEFAASQVS